MFCKDEHFFKYKGIENYVTANERLAHKGKTRNCFWERAAHPQSIPGTGQGELAFAVPPAALPFCPLLLLSGVVSLPHYKEVTKNIFFSSYWRSSLRGHELLADLQAGPGQLEAPHPPPSWECWFWPLFPY